MLVVLAPRTRVLVVLAPSRMRVPAVLAGAQRRVLAALVPRTREAAEPLGQEQAPARVQWQRSKPLSARLVVRGWGLEPAGEEQGGELH